MVVIVIRWGAAATPSAASCFYCVCGELKDDKIGSFRRGSGLHSGANRRQIEKSSLQRLSGFRRRSGDSPFEEREVTELEGAEKVRKEGWERTTLPTPHYWHSLVSFPSFDSFAFVRFHILLCSSFLLFFCRFVVWFFSSSTDYYYHQCRRRLANPYRTQPKKKQARDIITFYDTLLPHHTQDKAQSPSPPPPPPFYIVGDTPAMNERIQSVSYAPQGMVLQMPQ